MHPLCCPIIMSAEIILDKSLVLFPDLICPQFLELTCRYLQISVCTVDLCTQCMILSTFYSFFLEHPNQGAEETRRH